MPSAPTEIDEPAPRPITGGATMSAVSRVSVAACGAVTTILIARLLGPGGSGGYFVAQSLILLLTVVTTLGIEHGIAYYVSAGSWDARPAMISALRTAALAGVLGAGLGTLARFALPSAFGALSTAMTIVTCASLPFALAWFYVTFVALALDRYGAYVVPPAAQSALAMLLAGAGAIAFGLEGAVIGAALATACVGVGATAWGLTRVPAAGGSQPAGQLRRAVAFGVKGYAANALQLVNFRIDLFILAAVASAAEVGYYAVAVAVTGVLWLLPQAVSEVVFPRVAHLSAREGQSAQAHLEMVEYKGARHVVLAVVASLVLLAAALELLVVPVYGAQFRPAIDLGLILLPGVALIGIAGVLSATIVGRGKPVYSLYAVLVTTPLTIGLYIWLIPAMGADGAALASSISYAVNFVMVCIFYTRLTGRNVARLLMPTRSELRDLAALPGAVAEWARGRVR